MFGLIQKCVPRRGLTRLAGFLASRRWGYLTRCFIRFFIRQYQVDMSEAAQSDYRQFPTFNAFFTRQLKPGARVVADDPRVIVSPVDGSLGEVGFIRHETLMQAKGRYYSLAALLANQSRWVDCFSGGYFVSAYLSPKDYHRVHMPVAGRLREIIFVPGDYYSVNNSSIASVDEVFARNERVICLFDTAYGELAVILIGAMIVGSMVLSCCGELRSAQAGPERRDFSDQRIEFDRGDELGYFQLGSSVVMLFQSCVVDHCFPKPGDTLRMGQKLLQAV